MDDHQMSGENTSGHVVKGRGVNLVHPDTDEVGHELCSPEFPMTGSEFGESYRNDWGAHSYIKAISSLNGWKPDNREVSQNLDNRGNFRTHDRHFPYDVNEEETVRKDQQGLRPFEDKD
ncbi:unnamed protein product [Vicia faba]|uniref:Uncharacterized protein n=1 Tax=Vicia faba TaxID=3906 RepID=A0AAV1AHN4_VICFA|nr:unnamed protein product [Vicia faba]